MTFPNDGYSQLSMGVGGGLTVNFLRNSVSPNPSSIMPAIGYFISVPLRYQFIKKIAIESGLNYLTKSYSINRTDSLAGECQHFRNSFLQIPIQIRMLVFQKRKFEVTLNAGGFWSYWASSRIRGQVPNILNSYTTVGAQGQLIENIQWASYNTPYQFSNKRDNRFESGLLFGGEMSYKINSKRKLFASLLYMDSLTDLQKNYAIDNSSRINQTFLFSLGILTQLK
jgi:hypothetical protein